MYLGILPGAYEDSSSVAEIIEENSLMELE